MNERPRTSLVYRGRRVLLKYHRLLGGLHSHPPNSLSALRRVLADGAEVIEFDVGLTGDGEYVLLHDATLERETSGTGPLRQITADQFRALRLRGTDEAPATLAEAVDILREVRRPLKVQVDLKEHAPVAPQAAARLLDALAPLRRSTPVRVVVGCEADWNLRALRRLDPTLAVGVDFALYLDAPDDGPIRLPLRVNAYGYLDDHPLGYRRLLPPAAYLEDRMEVLLTQVGGASEFYLRKEFVLQALGDGVNPIGFIHERLPGTVVDVWTLDAGAPDVRGVLLALLEAGADQISSPTAALLPDPAA
ncbi:MAG: glycerophosphodiester phosphodiesterase family protein [Armatimonadota bacterium]|nr:glycerophosphodiester phosphodiesterase family protein [Armatimonadota bacterium]